MLPAVLESSEGTLVWQECSNSFKARQSGKTVSVQQIRVCCGVWCVLAMINYFKLFHSISKIIHHLDTVEAHSCIDNSEIH